MPKISRFKQQKNKALALRALRLYKQGLSYRQIGVMVGKSHTWVANELRALLVDNLT